MKPVLIYTTERTRSTAVLQAAKRNIKLNEPFALHQYLTNDEINTTSVKKLLAERIQWDDVAIRMSDPNTATKFFGFDLLYYYPAQKWFSEVQRQETHEIFTLHRNMREVILSRILASRFGFAKSLEIENYEFEASIIDLIQADQLIDSFLRFYPKNSIKITFGSLPSEFFDYSAITSQNQFSNEKLHLIKNLNFVEEGIQTIFETYSSQWEDITGFGIFDQL